MLNTCSRTVIDSMTNGEGGRTCTGRSFGPDLATMFLHDALHCGEPNSRSLKSFKPMEALQDAEELVGEFHVKFNTVAPRERSWSRKSADLPWSGLSFLIDMPG